VPPVFEFTNAIEHTVFVESEVDSDGDGRRDRVRIRISRPGETATKGIKVPVVAGSTPTAARTWVAGWRRSVPRR
jgi:X-Pro dipeptidyl-peptidase